MWAPFVVAVLLLASIAGGVFLDSGLFARPVIAADPRAAGARIALTFDDGPNPVYTEQILDLLDAGQHRATFFVVGQRAESSPDLIAEISKRGHLVANHSFYHSNFTPFHSPARLAAELERTQSVIEKATGVRPRWFRPPIGLLSPRVVEAARRCKLDLVGWTASARDGGRRPTVGRSFDRLRCHLHPGAILVLHDSVLGGKQEPIAPALLERLLLELDRRGLQSVTLDDLFPDQHCSSTARIAGGNRARSIA